MFKTVIKLILLLLTFSSLFAKDGLSQEHLLSVSSQIKAEQNIEIKFDLPIVKSSIHKHSIVVKSNHKKIKGIVRVKNKNILVFIPQDTLSKKSYKVKVKPIKLLNLKSRDESRFHKLSAHMCSWFYNDIKKCKLYRYSKTSKTKKIKFPLNIENTEVKITSLKLNKEKVSLADDSITTIDAIALYEDNTSKTVTNEVEWLIGDTSIISLDKKTITPLKEGTTTLQAKYNKQESQIIEVEIYKEINGYKLPPEPDETLNNSTLLGIDVNDNGVRDDVERWIYIEYKDKHPVHIDIAMQAARSYKMVLETPELAKEITDEVSAAMYCEWYYKTDAKYFNEALLVTKSVASKYFRKNIYFNTTDRYAIYRKYGSYLSGGVYTLPEINEEKAYCDFNTSKYKK